jgi:hypothetical protein
MVTVSELIKQLQQLPPDAVVLLESNECTEPAKLASVNKQPFYESLYNNSLVPEDCLWFELSDKENAAYAKLKESYAVNEPEARDFLAKCGFKFVANNPVIITD